MPHEITDLNRESEHWVWYKKLNEAIEVFNYLPETDKEEHLIFASDLPIYGHGRGGAKKFAVVNRWNKHILRGPHLYVMLAEMDTIVYPFFDFDQEHGDCSLHDDMNITKEIRETLIAHRETKMLMQIKEFLMIAVQANTDDWLMDETTSKLRLSVYRTHNKFSFHVHVHDMAIRLSSLKALAAKCVPSCDMSVYNRHHAFRLPGSSKAVNCETCDGIHGIRLLKPSSLWSWTGHHLEMRATMQHVKFESVSDTKEHRRAHCDEAICLVKSPNYRIVDSDHFHHEVPTTPALYTNCEPREKRMRENFEASVDRVQNIKNVVSEICKRHLIPYGGDKDVRVHDCPGRIIIDISSCSFCVIAQKFHQNARFHMVLTRHSIIFTCFAAGCKFKEAIPADGSPFNDNGNKAYPWEGIVSPVEVPSVFKGPDRDTF